MRNILILFVPHVIILRAEQPCCRVVVLYSYIGMGVMLMKHFDFSRHRRPPLHFDPRVVFYTLFKVNPLWAVALFYEIHL